MIKNKILMKIKSQLGAYLIDFVMLFILCLVIICDIFIFKKIIENYNYLIQISSVVITLLPAIITILSISLSISKEKIYGVTLNEINSLRGPFYFNFFHVTLIMCCIVGIYSFLSVFSLTISIYLLEFISLSYSIYFVIQEIPILIHSNTRISYILKKYYLKHPNQGLFQKNKKDIFNTILMNIIMTEGIETAYNMLFYKNVSSHDLLNYLLELQNNFLWNYEDNVPNNKTILIESYHDINVIDFIEKGYENINEVCRNSNKYSIEQKYYYQVTRAIYVLHRLCSNFGLNVKENNGLEGIINNAIFSKNINNDSILLSTVITMIATTLNDGEIWFAKKIRDNNSSLMFIFDNDNNSLGLFISMIFAHINFKSGLKQESKEKFIEFINEKENGLNSNGQTWKEYFNIMINNFNPDLIVNSIFILLKYYDSVNDTSFYFHGQTKKMFYSANEDFTKKDIFHNWLLLLFWLSYYNYLNLDFDLQSIYEKFCYSDKEIFVNEISENWIDFDSNNIRLKDNIDKNFFKYYSIELNFLNNSQLNKFLIDDFVKIHDSYFKTVEKESSKIDFLTESKSIIDTFNNICQNDLFDKDLMFDDNSRKYYKILLPNDKFNDIFKSYLKNIEESIQAHIRSEVKVKLSIEDISYGALTDDDVAKIIDFKPEFTSAYRKLQSYSDNENNKYAKAIKLLSINGVDVFPNLYWKNKAISFKIELVNNIEMIRRLTNEELDDIIDKKYKPFDNGLYRYNKYANDSKTSFYVTRDELKSYIFNDNILVFIPFNFIIQIVNKNILSLNVKKDQ